MTNKERTKKEKKILKIIEKNDGNISPEKRKKSLERQKQKELILEKSKDN